MKISNILFAFIAFVGLGLLASCDVNDEFYKEFDEEKGFQLIENLEYTLSDDDYEEMGDDAKKYGSFSKNDPAADHLPEFLANKYPTLDATSTVNVTYNFYRGKLNYVSDYLNYLKDLENIESYTLTTDDYDSMGEESNQPGKYNNFSSSTPAEDYLPDFLKTKYPDAVSGDEKAITYKYYDGKVINITEFWAFDGTNWSKSDKVAPTIPDGVKLYELTEEDYDSMGTNSGEPGKYNNFDEDMDINRYLSIFLSNKMAYAVEGDQVFVLYSFYNEEDEDNKFNETKAQEFTLTEGVWKKYSSTIEKTDQYIKTEKGWLFDPTVLYTMVADDYQMLVDYVKANKGEEYVDSYGTAESYYGSSAYYKEFNIREGDYHESFAKWEDAVKEAVGVFLPIKFTDAVAQVDGVDVNYVITFAGYAGSMVDYTITFKCTKSGPNPEFEYVEGPTLK